MSLEVRLGMVLVPKRGSGRQWLVSDARPGRDGAMIWRLSPMGGDVGGFGGVKPIWRTTAELNELGWERAASV